ncbi:hypothetical protein DFJ73DRAFT_764191 [Zopfochytrium polystomum]|nr:hypothetical protein DFJ73DRAFT_764191 [Zopfochytrium polystomum]
MKKAGASEQAAEKQVPKQPSNQPIAKKDNTSESVSEIKSQINNSLQKGLGVPSTLITSKNGAMMDSTSAKVQLWLRSGRIWKTAQAAERKRDQLDEEDALSITSMTKKAAEFPSIEAELEDDEESCWEDFFPGLDVAWQSFTLKTRLLELISDNSGAHLLVSFSDVLPELSKTVELTSNIQSIIREISSVTNILNAWMNVTFINYPEVPTRQNKSKDLHPFTTLERRLQEEDNLASSNKKQRSEREDEA